MGLKWSVVEDSGLLSTFKGANRNAKPQIPISKYQTLYPKPSYLSNRHIQMCGLYPKSHNLSSLFVNEFVTNLWKIAEFGEKS